MPRTGESNPWVLKSLLSPSRQRLVEILQEVCFGRIEDLEVRDGEPVLDPRPRVLRVILLGKENRAHAARESADFALKDKVAGMFAVFDSERSLHIKELIIDNGLPVRMTVADGARA